MKVTVSSRGASRRVSRRARRTGRESPVTPRVAHTTAGSSCARKSKRVTTPKLPPPPRSAQSRSGCDASDTSRTSPPAVTSCAPTSWSAASPHARTIQPMPPPRVRPPTPTDAVSPELTPSPRSARARATLPHVAPPPTRTSVPSTSMSWKAARSIVSPPGTAPHALWPPERTMTSRCSSAAYRRAARTSSTEEARTITAGSPMPEWKRRAVSQSGSPGAATAPGGSSFRVVTVMRSR